MEEHRKLYEEELVKEIMISTALCILEMAHDDDQLAEDDVCQFIEDNYNNIIEETITTEIDEEDDPEPWDESKE